MLFKTNVLKSEKVDWELQIGKNTLYKLHVHFEQIKILHVITQDWNYINIVNYSKFWISREGKLHISGRNRKRWDEIVVIRFSHRLLVPLFDKT